VRRLAVASLAVASLAALALAGCGGADEGQAPPPTLAAGTLPELDSRGRILDVDGLAVDAFRPAEFARFLEDAGFVSGREREFSGKSRTWDRVVARTLLFESDEGARAYVDWLERHAEELLGKAAPADWSAPGDAGVAFVLVPCGSCKKELPTFFAGWRRDATVATLLAAGAGANEGRFAELTRRLDARVRVKS
jgi:hypothetical protein